MANMLFPISSLGKRPYTRLGRLLAKRMPDIALTLLQAHDRETTPPLDTDFGRLETYLKDFCRIRDLDEYDLFGSLFKPIKVDKRREFIACMLHIYNPQVFLQPHSDIVTHYGFTSALADALMIHRQMIKPHVREVIIQERVYPEFAQLVNTTLSHLLKQEVSHGSTEG